MVGGIVDEALKIADYIAEKDSVLLYEVDKENKEVVKKSENAPIINMPIILLTNENTATFVRNFSRTFKRFRKS